MAGNDIVKAVEYFERSLGIAEDIDAREEVMMNYQNLSLAYAAMKDFKKASSYMDSYFLISKILKMDSDSFASKDSISAESLTTFLASEIALRKSVKTHDGGFGRLWLILFVCSNFVSAVLLFLLLRKKYVFIKNNYPFPS